MKKFLKVFSVVALICCCMFSFVGCDIFEDKKEEYAGLVAERKIVREVVNNTKAMLEANIEQEAEPAPTGSDISARSGYDFLGDCVEELNMFIVMTDAVINAEGFVPGKLYNFEETEYTTEGGGTTYHYYYLINAYCGEGNVVTLNISNVGDKDNRTYATDSSSVVIDIHYNNEHKPTRFVNYSSGYNSIVDGTGIVAISHTIEIEDMVFSSTGECEGLHDAYMSFEYSLNWTVQRTWKNVMNVDKDNEVTRYEEHSHATPMEGSLPFTDEIRTVFNNEIEIAKERTYIFNFARPLPQDVVDAIFDAAENDPSDN